MSKAAVPAAVAVRIFIPILSISWHGGTRVLIQVANHLAGLGYRVVFLVSRNRCITPFSFAEGVDVKHIGVHTGFKAIDYPIFLCCVPFHIVAGSQLIASFFITYLPVRLVAAIFRLPYVYFVQDIESKYAFPRGVILNAVCNWTYRDRRIVTANTYLHNRLKGEFGTDSRHIEVGPDAIFYDLPQQGAKRYDVIYLLRRESWKGLDRFLRFLKLSDGRLSCLCVTQDDELRSVIAGSSAEFRRPDNDLELVQCMDSARVLLLTSYREGFALPPLEAMARGVPAVLFRCGGPDQYIVDGGNAMYVADESQAVRTIETLVHDAEKYEAMRREALLTADSYRMDKSLALMARFVAECPEW